MFLSWTSILKWSAKKSTGLSASPHTLNAKLTFLVKFQWPQWKNSAWLFCSQYSSLLLTENQNKSSKHFPFPCWNWETNESNHFKIGCHKIGLRADTTKPCKSKPFIQKSRIPAPSIQDRKMSIQSKANHKFDRVTNQKPLLCCLS